MVALILAFLLPLIQGPTLAEVDAARDALRPFLDALAVSNPMARMMPLGTMGMRLGAINYGRHIGMMPPSTARISVAGTRMLQIKPMPSVAW